MIKPERNIRPGLFCGSVPDTINVDDMIIQLPSSRNCYKCHKYFDIWFSNYLEEFAALPTQQRISVLEEITINFDLTESLFTQNRNNYFKMKLEIEKKALELEQTVDSICLPTLTPAEHLTAMGVESIRANGTMSEIAKLFGNALLNSKNSKGDHLFDIDGVRIAKLICILFILTSKKALNQHSVEKAVGEGRNQPKKD
jgi:hypothetical protein